jgi:cellulose synthase/poly-beta-1,6-N-acetylglucosamine synthase-like glycosyltransferase
MTQAARSPLSYALITPVRDEEVNLARLADSVERQTLKPDAWVIVDTGSTDATPRLMTELSARMPFVRTLTVEGPAVPTRGGPIVRAFVAGIDSLGHAPDVLIKQDADTSFDACYFERVLSAFAADARLGLTSGASVEPVGGQWRVTHGARDHVRGPSRAYRWQCLQDVLPLDEHRGWDEIDSIKAQIRGWRVGTLSDVTFIHHRPDGLRDGSRRRRWMRMGSEAHYMGYRFSYLLIRSGWRAREDPLAMTMVAGYLDAAIHRRPRYPDPAVRRHLHKQQSPLQLPLRLRESIGRAT